MIKFGTGGWRAVIGDEFTRENIQKLSRALVNKMKDEGVAEQGIAIGYDRRFLSKEAAIWASEVFAAEGVPVKFILGSAPTPLIMFFVMRHEMPYGMMITASHNPAVYNGIKVFTKGGRDADELQTQEIERYIHGIEEEV
ncbi:MAG: phosphoglucomutase/phosphomannomutase family protein, partial [Hungatella hathewayi]|nr:phosphoglucomutase/phosphomannomutase family protein [Hungatella hathewayi]